MMEEFFVNTDRECDEKMYDPRSVDVIIADAKGRSGKPSGRKPGTSDGQKKKGIDKHNTP